MPLVIRLCFYQSMKSTFFLRNELYWLFTENSRKPDLKKQLLWIRILVFLFEFQEYRIDEGIMFEFFTVVKIEQLYQIHFDQCWLIYNITELVLMIWFHLFHRLLDVQVVLFFLFLSVLLNFRQYKTLFNILFKNFILLEIPN